MKLEVSHTGKPVATAITEGLIEGTLAELYALIDVIENAGIDGEATVHILHADGPVPLRIRCV